MKGVSEMNGVKTFFNGLMYSAGFTGGCILAIEAYRTIKDPYRRAKIKRSVSNIKNKITKK